MVVHMNGDGRGKFLLNKNFEHVYRKPCPLIVLNFVYISTPTLFSAKVKKLGFYIVFLKKILEDFISVKIICRKGRWKIYKCEVKSHL